MADANDSFRKLEEKLCRAVEVFKQTQAERRALEQELERVRADLRERAKRLETQERELLALRREREEVRSRVEKIVEQIEILTKPESG